MRTKVKKSGAVRKRKSNPSQSLAQVTRNYPQFSKLIKAVISDIGVESVDDVNNYGAESGFGSFVYYTDTHKFAQKFQTEINELLESEAMNSDCNVVELVSNFGVFSRDGIDSEDQRFLYKYLAGVKVKEPNTITNVMAWFALETVCRMFE